MPCQLYTTSLASGIASALLLVVLFCRVNRCVGSWVLQCLFCPLPVTQALQAEGATNVRTAVSVVMDACVAGCDATLCNCSFLVRLYVPSKSPICTWQKYTLSTPSGITVHRSCLYARRYQRSGYGQRSWFTTWYR